LLIDKSDELSLSTTNPSPLGKNESSAGFEVRCRNLEWNKCCRFEVLVSSYFRKHSFIGIWIFSSWISLS